MKDISKINKTTVATVEVARGTTHDGPGIRTTVFTKGCSLSCRWCQNPESISLKQEIWYESGKCIGCLDCVKTCRNSALEASETGIKIYRDKCLGCGDCAETCPAKALTFTGTVWTVDELVREVMKDKTYYEEFNGGVTVSGGEPLIHADFLIDFFRKLKGNGIHTALDTCGCVCEEAVMKVMPYIDAVFYDIKLMDFVRHKELTGKGNQRILENLKAITEYIRKAKKEDGCKILLWIRTPLIPGETDTEDNIIQIADFIAENILSDIERWELCSFNPACIAKYIKMQRNWYYEKTAMMMQNKVDMIKELALSHGIPDDKLIVTGLIKPD